MKASNVLTTVAVLWASVAVYDVTAGLPQWWFLPVAIGWLVTMVTAYLFAPRIPPANALVKFISFGIIAYAIFVSFGFAVDFLVRVLPNVAPRYQKILLLFGQMILAALFSALLVAFPVAAIYRAKCVLAVLVASLPTVIFQLYLISTSEKLTGKLMLSFEILFRSRSYVWLLSGE